jgi:hypothetical protein
MQCEDFNWIARAGRELGSLQRSSEESFRPRPMYRSPRQSAKRARNKYSSSYRYGGNFQRIPALVFRSVTAPISRLPGSLNSPTRAEHPQLHLNNSPSPLDSGMAKPEEMVVIKGSIEALG